MKSAVRTTAVAATLAVFSCGAFAEAVLLDFEALGQQALRLEAPVAVGNVLGFNFHGAYAYEFNMLTMADNQPDATNFGGFLMNRDRTANTAAIVVSLEELVLQSARSSSTAAAATATSAFPGQFFQSISFELFVGGDVVPILTASNALGESVAIQLTRGDGEKRWSRSGLYEFNPLMQFDRLEFSSGIAVLGLDNLSITLTAAGGGGTAPEPASYALVGLALLAAGTASSRRRS